MTALPGEYYVPLSRGSLIVVPIKGPRYLFNVLLRDPDTELAVQL